MKTWADFLDDIMPDLPGCSAALAQEQIKRAAIEYMDRSRVYQVDHPDLDAVTEVGEYAWNTGDVETEVCHVFNVWFDGERMTPKNGDFLAEAYDFWPDEVGTPNYYLQERTDVLILVPMPDEDLAGAITAKVAVRPTMTATGIPDDLFSDHREAISAGALYRLMKMQKKPWSNPEMAGVNLQAFNAAIDAARHQQQAGNVRSAHHVPNPRSRFC